jgi:hypothetical protein
VVLWLVLLVVALAMPFWVVVPIVYLATIQPRVRAIEGIVASAGPDHDLEPRRRGGWTE